MPILVTHGWTRVVLLPKLILLISLVAIIIGGAHEIVSYDSSVIDVLLFILVIAFFHFLLTRYFSAISTLLYVRYSLQTPISYKEALQISQFFEPNRDGVWYPMKHLLDLPVKVRRKALYETIDKITNIED